MNTTYQNGILTIFLGERIDSNNTNDTETQIMDALSRHQESAVVQIDSENLEYISSAGLRVLLKVRKRLKTPFLY